MKDEKIHEIITNLIGVINDLSSLLSSENGSSSSSSSSGPPPWPELKWLEGEIGGNYLKTRGLILAEGGKKLICPPYRAGRAIEIDIVGETIKYISGFPTGFVGQTDVSNGKQVINPAFAKGFSVYDNTTDQWTHNIGHQWQIRGSAEGADGIVYGPQFTPTSSKLLWLDTNTNKFDVVFPPLNRESYSFKGAWGAVGAKGRVFILPFSSPYVGFVEEGEKKMWRELRSYPCDGNGNNAMMYTHGRYHEQANLIVSLPRRSNAILTINPDSLEVKEIPLPQELIDLFPTTTKSFDCEIGPDGWVYSSPWAHPVMFRFEPISGMIEWKNLKHELLPARRLHQNPDTDVDVIAAPDGYFTAMKRVGNEIYFGTAGGFKGLKLVWPR